LSKKACYALITVFVLFLSSFALLQIFLPAREYSAWENRYLAQMPAFSLQSVFNGSYMKDVEEALGDQFYGREFWIGLKSTCERLLGKQENNDIYIGKEQTLIARFNEPDQERFLKNIAAVNNLQKNLQDKNIVVSTALVPGAVSIWQNRLPFGAPNGDQTALLKQAQEEMNSYVDIASVLQAHQEEALFYRTDHHWTTRGAYYAYAAICRAWQLEPKPLPTKEQIKIVSDDFFGTMQSKAGLWFLKPDAIELWADVEGATVRLMESDGSKEIPFYDESALDRKDQYQFFLGGNYPLLQIETGYTGEKLLVVKDSYANSLLPFFLPHFSQIDVIDLRFYRQSIEAYAKENKINTILFLYNIGSFAEDQNLVLFCP
jgi:hypothetical protein